MGLGERIVTQGINCVRGVAAQALTQLIRHDPARLAKAQTSRRIV